MVRRIQDVNLLFIGQWALSWILTVAQFTLAHSQVTAPHPHPGKNDNGALLSKPLLGWGSSQVIPVQAISIRETGKLYCIVGIGVVNGLHAGFRYNTTDHTSVELSIGNAPLTTLLGRKMFIVAGGMNSYMAPSRTISPMWGILASVVTLRSINDDGPLGNVYFLAPHFGIDGAWGESTAYFRFGFAVGVNSPGVTKGGFHFDIGFGLRV